MFSKVEAKEIAKKAGLNSGAKALDCIKSTKLSEEQLKCCWNCAIEAAKADGKKTVMDRHIKYIVKAVEKCQA